MSEKIIATEEMRLEKEWFKEAREQTFETLPNDKVQYLSQKEKKTKI